MKHNIFLLLAAAIVALVCSISGSGHTYSQPKHIVVNYVVQSGDGLFNIAEKYCPAGMDIRQFVGENLVERNWDLLKANQTAGHLWKTILPGQTIVVEYWAVDE